MPEQHYTKPNHPRFVDMTGRTYGRLKVVEYRGTDKGHNALWACECSCGVMHVTTGRTLRSGGSRSCGCLQKEGVSDRFKKHGDTGKPIKWAYNNMIQRCYNPKFPRFKDYGGRGISVCEEWRAGYLAFRNWAIANGYREGLTIERKDVNGHYSPENCCWIPMSMQGHNRRNNRYLTAFGETKTVVLWTKDPRCKVIRETIMARLRAGWPVADAIATPPKLYATSEGR